MSVIEKTSGIERIKERILEDANKKAQELKDKAHDEAKAISKEATKKAKNKKDEIIEIAKKEAAILKKRLIASAQIDGNKDKFNSKQGLVDEAFEKAISSLCKLPDLSYERVLIDIILQIAEIGDEEILLNDNDKKRIGEKFISNLNKDLKKKGLKGMTVLSKQAINISGGVVLKSGNIEINGSFEALLRMKKEYIEPEVYKILF